MYANITVFDASGDYPEMVLSYQSRFVPQRNDRLFVGDKLYIVSMVTWGNVENENWLEPVAVALFCEPAE